MSNHIKFLSWRGNHGVPNCQMMSGSMIMLWGLPHVLAAEQVVPTPLPSSCICPPRAAQDHWEGSYRSCQMLVADFEIAFGSVLCQGFVTPPASQVPALLTAPGLVGSHGAQPGLTAGSGQPSLGRGWGTSRWALDFLGLTCSFSSKCWGSFLAPLLAPLLMLFSSWKRREGSSAMLVLTGWMMQVVHVEVGS